MLLKTLIVLFTICCLADGLGILWTRSQKKVRSVEFKNCRVALPSKLKKNLFTYIRIFHWEAPLSSFNAGKQTINHNETVEMFCQNGFVKTDFIAKNYTFQCTDGKFNNTFDYEDLLCRSDFHKNTETSRISPIQLKSTLFACEASGLDVYRVKAKKEDGSFKHLYDVCFDKKYMRPKFVLEPKRNESFLKNNLTRKDVWGFDFFGRNATEKYKLSLGYSTKFQKKLLTGFFSPKYNKSNPYPFSFNRGHLAPYSNFIDLDDKKASCQYINAAPQWREFNSATWASVEQKAKKIVGRNRLLWEIYTGVFGSIQNEKNENAFISPSFSATEIVKGYVPIPKLFWKIVYNVQNKTESRVFVGVNNPELNSTASIKESYLVCTPKKDGQGNIFSGSRTKGFAYECSLDDFISHLKQANESIIRI